MGGSQRHIGLRGGPLDCALARIPALVSTWQMPGLALQEARMCATRIVLPLWIGAYVAEAVLAAVTQCC